MNEIAATPPLANFDHAGGVLSKAFTTVQYLRTALVPALKIMLWRRKNADMKN